MQELTLLYFIYLISIAEFAWQIQLSTLSDWVKEILYLNTPYNRKLTVMSTKVFWNRLFGKWWFIAIPLIIGIRLHQFIYSMVSCPYCVCYHMAWMTNYFIFKIPLFDSFILAPIALIFVAILGKLHS